MEGNRVLDERAIFLLQNSATIEQASSLLRFSQSQTQESEFEVWKREKMAKFSASRIQELCTRDKSRKQLGKVANNYILDIFSEYLGEKRENYVSKEMQYGIDNEPFAAKLLGVQFSDLRYFGKKFFPCPKFELYAGASPDFMVRHDISGEIKTACTAKKQLEYLALRNASDLLDYDKKYFYQVQMQMVCTGADKAYFATFYPKWVNTDNHKLCLHILQIGHNEKVIKDIENSLNLSIEVFENLKQKYAV